MKKCFRTFRLTEELSARLERCAEYYERTQSDIIYRCLAEYLPVLEATIEEEKKTGGPFSSLAKSKPRMREP